jgi:hypothetical protein
MCYNYTCHSNPKVWDLLSENTRINGIFWLLLKSHDEKTGKT